MDKNRINWWFIMQTSKRGILWWKVVRGGEIKIHSFLIAKIDSVTQKFQDNSVRYHICQKLCTCYHVVQRQFRIFSNEKVSYSNLCTQKWGRGWGKLFEDIFKHLYPTHSLIGMRVKHYHIWLHAQKNYFRTAISL